MPRLLPAFAWLALIHVFAVHLVAQWASAAPYSVADQFISDLANTACGPYQYYTDESFVQICSPMHGVVNASFAVSGLLLLVGVVAAWRSWPVRRAVTVAKVMIAASGVGWILVSLAPENENLMVHGIGALAAIVGGNVGILILGLAVRRVPGWGGRSAWALVSGGIGTAATILFFANQYLGMGLGVMERLAVYPHFVWAVGMGVAWLAVSRQPRVPMARAA